MHTHTHTPSHTYTCMRRDMDRMHIQEREKWKRDTAHKIKETKIQMMKLTGGFV